MSVPALLAMACGGWVLRNTKESNNNSIESSKRESELKAIRKRSKYSKALVNET